MGKFIKTQYSLKVARGLGRELGTINVYRVSVRSNEIVLETASGYRCTMLKIKSVL